MENLKLEEAVDLLVDRCKSVTDVIEVPLMDALGKVAAEDVVATIDNPPFNRSPLDGYTFASADTIGASKNNPVRFAVVGEECAGDFFVDEVQTGQAVRIMTGAAIPKGCDCVIRQEDVTMDENGELLVYQEMVHLENFCFAGEDFKAGTVLVKKETELKAAYLGVLASLGCATVKIYRPVKVLLASTGDELVSPGEMLTPGKIYNSNQYILAGRLKEMGLEVEVVNHLPDDEDGAAAVLRQYHGKVDLLLTTGGVSVGKKDIMHGVVKKLPAERLFWRVSMKPGSPAIAYDFDGTLGIALSGNPFAAFATFELIARPVLAKLAQRASIMPQIGEAVLMDEFGKKSKGRRVIRAKIVDGKAYLPENHRSGALASAAECNGFIDIPAGSGALEIGSKVKTIML